MDLELQPAPETKGAGENALELKDAFDDFMSAFEGFRAANDERLEGIERKLSADVVTEEKVARISDALDSQKRLIDRLTLKNRRPELGPSTILDAIAEILDAMDSPEYYLFLQPPFRPEHGFDNVVGRAEIEANQAEIAALIGDGYVPTYEAFAAAAISDPEAPGYAEDQADVANGVCPASLRNDNVHLNAAGQAVHFAAARAHAIDVKGWAIEP